MLVLDSVKKHKFLTNDDNDCDVLQNLEFGKPVQLSLSYDWKSISNSLVLAGRAAFWRKRVS